MSLAAQVVEEDEASLAEWREEVRALARARDAVVLAHNYQLPAIQDVADHVGDSLALARLAARTDASVIVMCGVHFMAETAKLLSPDKTVLIPTLAAGCSLADTIDAEQLRAWKAEHPGAAVVAYVNTSAEVKAEADICCTSSNAVDVVNSIDRDQPVLFLPDQFLGAHVRRETGRDNLHVWMGECHVHAGISPQDMADSMERHPDAELLIHPECGCATSAMWAAGAGVLPLERVHVTSTSGMLDRARESRSRLTLVATEVDMIHQLRQANTGTEFVAVNPKASCRYMKMITPELLVESLRDGRDEVVIAPDVAERARASVARMIEIGAAGGTR
ncbi:MAG TPA: quinolinate synthase NadA [Mycobacteriales bacterium]|jgi:quinolinate synthase|nr:quinolinate synthase NadA [Mycobacteriales bacterium]